MEQLSDAEQSSDNETSARKRPRLNDVMEDSQGTYTMRYTLPCGIIS